MDNYKQNFKKMNNNITCLLLSTRKKIWDLLEQYYNLTNFEFSRLKYEYDYHFGTINEKIVYYKELESRIKYRPMHIDNEKSSPTSYCADYATSSDYLYNSDEGKLFKTNFENIRRYYRDLVKYLHPDVSDTTCEFANFWYQIQDSYKASDEFRLGLYWRTIINKVEDKEYESDVEKNTAIKNEINNLNFKIQQIIKMTKDLYLKEPYIFADKINDKSWIISHRRELESKLYTLKKKIIILESNYS